MSKGGILEGRRIKLLNFLNISNWRPSSSRPFVEVVRHEDIYEPVRSTAWLAGLAARHKLRVAKKNPEPVVHFKSRNDLLFNIGLFEEQSIFLARKRNSSSKKIVAMVNSLTSQLDWGIESMAGYSALTST